MKKHKYKKKPINYNKKKTIQYQLELKNEFKITKILYF